MARPTNALIVDDEAHVRAFMRLLLREVGIDDCWEAGDGNTGLLLAQKHRPGIVLLDINLPGLNGLEVLAQLKKVDEDMPVVMATSQSSITTVSEAVRLGALGYLLKHSSKEEAVKALREIVDSLADEEGGSG